MKRKDGFLGMEKQYHTQGRVNRRLLLIDLDLGVVVRIDMPTMLNIPLTKKIFIHPIQMAVFKISFHPIQIAVFLLQKVVFLQLLKCQSR